MHVFFCNKIRICNNSSSKLMWIFLRQAVIHFSESTLNHITVHFFFKAHDPFVRLDMSSALLQWILVSYMEDCFPNLINTVFRTKAAIVDHTFDHKQSDSIGKVFCSRLVAQQQHVIKTSNTAKATG